MCLLEPSTNCAVFVPALYFLALAWVVSSILLCRASALSSTVITKKDSTVITKKDQQRAHSRKAKEWLTWRLPVTGGYMCPFITQLLLTLGGCKLLCGLRIPSRETM